MGTGVSTVPSSPDFLFEKSLDLSKLDMVRFLFLLRYFFFFLFFTNSQILDLLVSVSLMSHNTYTPDLSTSSL